VKLLNQWCYRPEYVAITPVCANTQMGVWSENAVDRSGVVAVYGEPA
jgi:hypothetical protein